MSTFNAFEMSPVPTPSKDAQPPEPFHGIYGMPMFVTSDVGPGRLGGLLDGGARLLPPVQHSRPLVHLRRWAFQDVLLVPAPQEPSPAPGSVA